MLRDCSQSKPVLIALGLTGGHLYPLNYSLFKSVLFLGAGSIWFRTGHRDIEKLGGIGKRMPVISIAMLVGSMAMAALPPLNGFAGEWVIYQSFFNWATAARLLVGSVRTAAGGWPGDYRRVGGDVYGEKVYGVTLPARRARVEAEKCQLRADPDGRQRGCAGYLLRTGRVAAPWLLPMISTALPLPLETAHTTVSQPMITLLLVACPLLPFIIMAMFKRQPSAVASPRRGLGVRLRP